MKIKTFADDFKVTEIADLHFSDNGKYSIFKVTKSGWSTFDLIDAISSRLKINSSAVNIAGIKDRHGLTTQYISIESKLPVKDSGKIDEEKIQLPDATIEYLGRIDKKLTSSDILKNKFTIVIRSISEKECEIINRRFELIKDSFIPNYFDDQRFGSVRNKLDFSVKYILKHDYETAFMQLLWPSKYDRKSVKEAKMFFISFFKSKGYFNKNLFDDSILRKYNFNIDEKNQKCMDIEFRKHIKSIPSELKTALAYLYSIDSCSNNAFQKALEKIDRRFLILIFHAYQSHLFNIILQRYILKNLSIDRLLYSIKGESGNYVFPEFIKKAEEDGILTLYLPVLGKDWEKIAIFKEKNHGFDEENNIDNKRDLMVGKREGQSWDNGFSSVNWLIEEIKKIEREENIDINSICGREVGISIVAKLRKAFIKPEDFYLYDFEDDDFFKGKKKVKIEFTLDRGCYATMVVKDLILQGKYGKAEEISLDH